MARQLKICVTVTRETLEQKDFLLGCGYNISKVISKFLYDLYTYEKKKEAVTAP